MRLRAVLLLAFAASAAGFVAVQPQPPDERVVAPTLQPLYAPALEALDTHVLRRGETLSDVFSRARLTGSDLSGLLLALREQIDPRRVLPNTAVLVRRWARDGRPRAVEVTLNADSTLLFHRRTVGWYGELVLTPTEPDTVVVTTELGPGGSLYSAIVGHPALDLPFSERESLVWKLAHIYGWELDFAHDLRPDDAFRLVVERSARPDGSSRESRILVAEVSNQDRVRTAIFFDPRGDGGDYFDREGNSLRRAFLRYPVDFPRITSNFSWQRYHPILKRNRPHLGTDFGTGRGAPVRATADGVIAHASRDGGYGNLIRIRHGNGYETRYAHLSRFAPRIRRGTRVRQGQVIGYSGETGLATAPHLHYELRRGGRPANPRTVRLPSAPPVPQEHMATFRRLAAERLALLPTTPAEATTRAD